MKIGIMGAMIEEVNAIKEAMIVRNETTRADRTYYEGQYCGHNIILTFSRWGKVAASSTVTTLLEKFKVEMIIFTGVAGAVSPDLNVGDVVVSKNLYQHDMDGRPLMKQFEIPLTGRQIFSTNPVLLEKAKQAAEKFVSQINQCFGASTLSRFSIDLPRVVSGTIASGDQFVTDAATRKTLQISPLNEMAHACEMEGAAVAQICHEYQIPYMIFRIISDKADHGAEIDFPAFIREVASKYSQGIVAKFLDELLKPNTQ